MKTNMTLALAASILTLTVSAFPHRAAGSSTTAPPTSDSQAIRKAGGSPMKYMEVVLASSSLLSALLP
jgi:hypothetical protein